MNSEDNGARKDAKARSDAKNGNGRLTPREAKKIARRLSHDLSTSELVAALASKFPEWKREAIEQRVLKILLSV